jgi:hypothetical protein
LPLTRKVSDLSGVITTSLPVTTLPSSLRYSVVQNAQKEKADNVSETNHTDANQSVLIDASTSKIRWTVCD